VYALVPVTPRIQVLIRDETNSFAVRPMLPQKESHQSRLIMEKTVEEVPLIPEEHIHRIAMDKKEKPGSQCNCANCERHRRYSTKAAPSTCDMRLRGSRF